MSSPRSPSFGAPLTRAALEDGVVKHCDTNEMFRFTSTSQADVEAIKSQPTTIISAPVNVELAENLVSPTSKSLALSPPESPGGKTGPISFSQHQSKAGTSITPDLHQLRNLKSVDQQLVKKYIQTRIRNSSHCCSRCMAYFLLILTLILCICYSIGSISSTSLNLLTLCEGKSIADIWDHSATINSASGTTEGCWTTRSLNIDTHTLWNTNRFDHKWMYSAPAIVGCVFFSILALICLFLLVLHGFQFADDLIFMHNVELYKKSTKYTKSDNETTRVCVIKNTKLKAIKQWYDKILHTDSIWWISRIFCIEIFEIIVQTNALMYYNGYNTTDSTGNYLAIQPHLVRVYAICIALNCVCAGILWLLYAFNIRFHGNFFLFVTFFTDQLFDLCYAAFPFVIILNDPYNDEESRRINITMMGLLNSESIWGFFFTILPLMLIIQKCFSMLQTSTTKMRDKAYYVWRLTNKVIQVEGKRKNNTNAQNPLGFDLHFKSKKDITTITPNSTATPPEEAYKNILQLQQTQTKLELANASDTHVHTYNTYKTKSGNIKKRIVLTRRTKIGVMCLSALLIFYGVALISYVAWYLQHAQTYCANYGDTHDYSAHEELFVWNHCLYKVYPFVHNSNDYADACECRVLVVDWSSIALSKAHLTQFSVVRSALKEWRMLEKFKTSGIAIASNSNISVDVFDSYTLDSELFYATEMKAFEWSNIRISEIDTNIANWAQLQYFRLNDIFDLETLPSSISKLQNLKIFGLTRSGLIEFPESLCALSDLQVINIFIASIESVPFCVENLKHLRQFILDNSLLQDVPLSLLNMHNLWELSWYAGRITYDSLKAYNNLSDESLDLALTEYNHHTAFFLNANPLCYDDDYNISSALEVFLADTECCHDSMCYDPNNTVIGSVFCPPIKQQDGQCTEACDFQQCGRDGGDCVQLCFTQTNCTWELFDNNQCDEECNNIHCEFDNGYCMSNYNTTAICPESWCGDGFCDELCTDQESCDYDEADCSMQCINGETECYLYRTYFGFVYTNDQKTMKIPLFCEGFIPLAEAANMQEDFYGGNCTRFIADGYDVNHDSEIDFDEFSKLVYFILHKEEATFDERKAPQIDCSMCEP